MWLGCALLRFDGKSLPLLLETPKENLSRGMRLLQGIYTIRHNARHHLRGHLFQGRYKAVVVDGEDATYFRTLCDYIHLNPVRAGLLTETESLECYRWSSFPAHIGSCPATIKNGSRRQLKLTPGDNYKRASISRGRNR